MRIALLAPLPPEKNGIADYASHFRNALQGLGIEVATPLAGVATGLREYRQPAGRRRLERLRPGPCRTRRRGRLGEFIACASCAKRFRACAERHGAIRSAWSGAASACRR